MFTPPQRLLNEAMTTQLTQDLKKAHELEREALDLKKKTDDEREQVRDATSCIRQRV